MSASEIDCQRRWARHGDNPRHTCAQRLGHYFIGYAPTYHEYMVGHRENTRQETMAYDLVDGVVSTNVLAHGDDLKIRVSQRGGMDRSRQFKHRLLIAHGVDQQ